MEGVMADAAAQPGVTLDRCRDLYLRQSALPAFIDTQDIANMIMFSCSSAGASNTDQASRADSNTNTLLRHT